MAVPAYREKVIELDIVLSEGTKLFKNILYMEERMRKQLMSGDYKALLSDENTRSDLKQKTADLEDRRKNLVYANTGIEEYIKANVEKSSQPDLLEKLAEIRRTLQEIRAIHEVNRALLEERLRFSKELQELVLSSRLAYYDQNGRLQRTEPGSPKTLDQSC